MAAIGQLLQPNVLSRLVSQQMVAEQWILGFLGMEIGGRNEVNLGHGRNGNFDVFNNTRDVGEGRVPGTAAAVIRPEPVGNVQFRYPRLYEQIPLLSEELHNLRAIGDNGARDAAGTRMIKLQTRNIAQRAANWRATLAVGMLRDTLYMHRDGDSLYPNFTSTSAALRINFQMPAGNKTQLDMLGDGNIIDTSWDNPAADIPNHLNLIDAAFQELYGGRLENVLVQGAQWQNVINNDKVASQAGIANSPFKQFERIVGTRADGTPINASVGQLACRPGVTFWITDEGVKTGLRGATVFTKYVGDNQAIFMPSPDQGSLFMQIGSEPVSEYDGGPETVRFGQYLWSMKTFNPPMTNIFSLDNALSINDIPNSIANGTVVF
jgi:hypothetical protein